MAINLRTTQAETREQRLGTITQWEGNAAQLARDSAFTHGCGQGCDNGGRRLCEQNTPFPAGLDVRRAHRRHQRHDHPGLAGRSSIRRSAARSASPPPAATTATSPPAAAGSWKTRSPICTNLGEQDMVFGGIAKLEQTIREAWARHQPKVIFVATSCATGIIGDDVDSAARQLEEELGVIIVPLHCEGFKSKHWSSGWDVIEHGILRRLVRRDPPRKQDDLDQRHPSRRPGRVHPAAGAARAAGESGDGRQHARPAGANCPRRGHGDDVLRALLPRHRPGAGIRRAGGEGAAALRPRRHRRMAARNRPRHRPRGSGRGRDRPRARAHRPGTGRGCAKRLPARRGFVAAGAAFAHGLLADLRELGVEVRRRLFLPPRSRDRQRRSAAGYADPSRRRPGATSRTTPSAPISISRRTRRCCEPSPTSSSAATAAAWRC